MRVVQSNRPCDLKSSLEYTHTHTHTHTHTLIGDVLEVGWLVPGSTERLVSSRELLASLAGLWLTSSDDLNWACPHALVSSFVEHRLSIHRLIGVNTLSTPQSPIHRGGRR